MVGWYLSRGFGRVGFDFCVGYSVRRCAGGRLRVCACVRRCVCVRVRGCIWTAIRLAFHDFLHGVQSRAPIATKLTGRLSVSSLLAHPLGVSEAPQVFRATSAIGSNLRSAYGVRLHVFSSPFTGSSEWVWGDGRGPPSSSPPHQSFGSQPSQDKPRTYVVRAFWKFDRTCGALRPPPLTPISPDAKRQNEKRCVNVRCRMAMFGT